ncbi:MAG TPA: hypothetical protein VNJ01_12770 [Bacteriovoracaceae bacterium]|nr:hypothetical protein [Bacteriovoracaceae bacterium]
MSLLLATVANIAPAAAQGDFFKDKTNLENPLEIRDPFKAPFVDKQSGDRSQRKGFFETGQGQYSNIAQSSATDLKINDLRVVGVLIGRERRALVNASADKKTVIILKEGMKIGNEGGELKAILPGGIIIVEKIVNVYGQEEYLETVIPISK